ncbi:DUF1439 domain-containing protein [Variovorax sp. HJSM1_2]|uniref:DUF1439 domain-containing protein n=1 Tax=Variovorax sp. HJSM1_2 TaxID=3366263 RepID=UPI003BBE1121
MRHRLHPSPPRRRLILQLLQLPSLAGLLLVPTGAWSGFNFFTSEYTASRAELQAQLDKRFPLAQKYGAYANVALSEPQLHLDAATNRAAITARLLITSPFLKSESGAEGSVTVSSALRYDAARRALLLDQPRAEQLSLQGLSGRNAEQAEKIAKLVAQELLRDQALRSFTEAELTVGRKTYDIGDITVLADGIKVQLK